MVAVNMIDQTAAISWNRSREATGNRRRRMKKLSGISMSTLSYGTYSYHVQKKNESKRTESKTLHFIYMYIREVSPVQ